MEGTKEHKCTFFERQGIAIRTVLSTAVEETLEIIQEGFGEILVDEHLRTIMAIFADDQRTCNHSHNQCCLRECWGQGHSKPTGKEQDPKEVSVSAPQKVYDAATQMLLFDIWMTSQSRSRNLLQAPLMHLGLFLSNNPRVQNKSHRDRTSSLLSWKN